MLKKLIKKAFVFFVVNTYFIITTMALPNTVFVKGTSVNIRSGPGTSYKILGMVSLGYRISPINSVDDVLKNGKTWYKFSYNGQNAYIRSDMCKEMSIYTYDAGFENELRQKGFPESYKPGLRDLHANYPNWIFTLDNIGIDFDYAVKNELIGTRTLVNSMSISSYKSTDEGKYDWTTSTWPTFDGNAWVAASKEVTMYYMDPRNFLYDPYVFQFESQTFNPNVHTLDGVREMTKGTFLDDTVKTEGLVNENAAAIADAPAGLLPNSGNNIISVPGIQTTPWDSNIPVVPILQNNTNVIAFSNAGPGEITGRSLESYGPAASNSSNNYNNVYQGGNITSPIGKATFVTSPGVSDVLGPNEDIDSNMENTEPTSFAYTYLPKGTYTYADLIYDACRQVNANPYVIVSMILQEQGKSGSDSVSGKNSKFNGYYNYGNINSFASGGLTAIENGLKYASEEGSYNRPWSSKEKGIYGLCDFYANSYVSGGQDTFYLKKWNVQGNNMFKHQYMTNVLGAASEGQILGNAYDEKMMQMPHEFKIPYYNNMPNTNCQIPTKDGSPNNKLKKLEVSNYTITPSFDSDVNNYTLIVDENVNSVNIAAEAYDKKAAIGGVGNVLTVTTNTQAIVYCVAENGDIRSYNINIYKKGAEYIPSAVVNEYETPIIYNSNNVSNNVNNYYSSPIGPGVYNSNNNMNNNAKVYVGPSSSYNYQSNNSPIYPSDNNANNYDNGNNSNSNINFNVQIVEAPYTGLGPGQ